MDFGLFCPYRVMLGRMVAKPGPKPRPPEDRQASQLQIRINAADKAVLAAAAARSGKTLSAWAKGVLLRAAKRQSERRGR
jgi:predicted HicB family RNase H-like nuclease